MRFLEFGNKQNKKLLLIHGYNASWKMWNFYVKKLEVNYHIILPILDGHDEKIKSNFISVEKCADNIIDYVKKECSGEIYSICGASLGGTIAVDILLKNKLKIKKAVIDGAPLFPFKKFIVNIAIKQRLKMNKDARNGNKKLFKNIEKIYSKEAAEDMYNVSLQMSDITCKNANYSSCLYNLSEEIKKSNTEIFYWYGSKEAFLVKKSTNLIMKYGKNCKLKVFKGYVHGQLVLGNQELFLSNFENFLNN